MKKFLPVFLLMSFFLFAGCTPPASGVSAPEQTFSFTDTVWHYNKNDSRYYYKFKTDGTFIYTWYQDAIGNTSLKGIKQSSGTWKYLDDDKTSFSVKVSGSIESWYTIVNPSYYSFSVERDLEGPAGLSLFATSFFR